MSAASPPDPATPPAGHGPADPAGPPDPTLLTAATYASELDAWQHSLVPLAMGLPCWIVATPAGQELRLEPAADLDAVRHQLECFDRESLAWPPRLAALDPSSAPAARSRLPLSPWLWVLGLFAASHVQLRHPALVDATLLDADRVFAHGEAWRAFTSLWLHADLGHLVSNAGGGLLVFTALVQSFRRPLRAWVLLGAASVLGNLAAAALYFGEPYRSLGASTAVFAGLGLLSGRAFRVVLTAPGPRRLRPLAIPLLSGLVVLGLFGAGEARVDVLAHATGFLAGLLLGALTAPPAPAPSG